jgi:hypothetical protein
MANSSRGLGSTHHVEHAKENTNSKKSKSGNLNFGAKIIMKSAEIMKFVSLAFISHCYFQDISLGAVLFKCELDSRGSHACNQHHHPTVLVAAPRAIHLFVLSS